MRLSLRDRFAFWAEGVLWLRGFVLVFDGYAPSGRTRYINRINGHVVLGPEV